jgi:hypothetical protein
LAWLAELTGALDEVCDFLLRAAIVGELETDADIADPDLATVVDGRAAEVGSPLVRLREGSTIIELAHVVVSGTVPVQVLAWLALLFRKGPALAAWPGQLTTTWYDSRADAVRVRQTFDRLQANSVVEIVGPVDAMEVGGARHPPRSPAKSQRRRDRKKGRAKGDLASGVHVSPPLAEG